MRTPFRRICPNSFAEHCAKGRFQLKTKANFAKYKLLFDSCFAEFVLRRFPFSFVCNVKKKRHFLIEANAGFYENAVSQNLCEQFYRYRYRCEFCRTRVLIFSLKMFDRGFQAPSEGLVFTSENWSWGWGAKRTLSFHSRSPIGGLRRQANA